MGKQTVVVTHPHVIGPVITELTIYQATSTVCIVQWMNENWIAVRDGGRKQRWVLGLRIREVIESPAKHLEYKEYLELIGAWEQYVRFYKNNKKAKKK